SPFVIAGGTIALKSYPETTIANRSYYRNGEWAIAYFPPADQAATTIADWRSLFGSIDFCDCAHCKSLYGPAAYFVDVLQFLDQGSGTTSPLEVLLSRRPDLEHIELTCKNSDTPLPYVDLVNEILEAAIVPRSFHLPEGPDTVTALVDLKNDKVP